MIELSKDGDLAQRQVWLTAWTTVAACENCLSPDSAARWADQCLAAYNQKFPIEQSK